MYTDITDGILTISSITTAAEKYNNGEWPFGQYGCKIFSFVSFIFMIASRLSVVLLAFDRFLAVSAPMSGKRFKYRTRSFANFLCIGLWCFSILASSYTLVLRDEDDKEGVKKCVWVLNDKNLP